MACGKENKKQNKMKGNINHNLTKAFIVIEAIIIIFLICLVSTDLFEKTSKEDELALPAQEVQAQCHAYCTSFENASVFAFRLQKTDEGSLCNCVGTGGMAPKLLPKIQANTNELTGNVVYPVEYVMNR